MGLWRSEPHREGQIQILYSQKGVCPLRRIALGFTFAIVIIVLLSVAAFAAPWDIRGHWAEGYITTLLDQGVMQTYEDGQFKPNHVVTRGEFAEALAKAMYLEPVKETELTDLDSVPAKGLIAALVKENVVTGFPDKTFRPNASLTRAQVVTMLTKALGLGEKAHQINMHSFASYLDMNEEHWANRFVKTATELDILDGYPDGTFRPAEETTRAQAAKMVSLFKSFNTTAGFIADVYPSSNKLAVTTPRGERVVLKLADTALIGRNNRLVGVTDFLKTDKIFVITDSSGNARYVKAYGLINKADLTEEVSQMTNYLVDPFEVEALAKGDYNVVKPKLLTEIRTRLMAFGMTPEETDALLQKDWNELNKQGQTRLTESVAEATSLPLDMVKAVMAQDWEKVKALAKVEAIQRVVRGMMNSDLLS